MSYNIRNSDIEWRRLCLEWCNVFDDLLSIAPTYFSLQFNMRLSCKTDGEVDFTYRLVRGLNPRTRNHCYHYDTICSASDGSTTDYDN